MRLNIKKHLASCGVVLALSACASSPRQEAARFDTHVDQCLADIRQAKVWPLTADVKTATMDFAKQAQCVKTAQGQLVPTLVLSINQQLPLTIDVGLLVKKEVVLAASVGLLDAHYQPVKIVKFDQFTKRGDSYTTTVFLNTEDQVVRYLTLWPDAQQVGEVDQSLVAKTDIYPFAIASASTIAYGSFASGSEVTRKTWFSEIGEVFILAHESN